MTNNLPQKAVIYCRVSSTKNNNNNDKKQQAQETRSREYAKDKDYQVDKVFSDQGSGNYKNRPAMQEMLAYLNNNRDNSHVVIIDDISRLARDMGATQ